MKVLLLDPHMDDIALFCTGFILANPEHDYYIQSFSNCDNNEILEELSDYVEILEKLDINITFDYTNFKRRKFHKKRQRILNFLITFKDYDIIFCPSKHDTHQDHKVIYEESFRVFKNKTLISYIHPHNCQIISPNYFIELTDEHVKQKVELLSLFKSQQERHYFNPDSIYANLIYYGSMTGRKYCEAFEIIRYNVTHLVTQKP